jgi:hypothetical protein
MNDTANQMIYDLSPECKYSIYMTRMCKKIFDAIDAEVKHYAHAYVSVCDDFARCDDYEKRVIGAECYRLLTDYAEISDAMHAWSYRMFLVYESVDRLDEIDGGKLHSNGYKEFIDWAVIDAAIVDLFMS